MRLRGVLFFFLVLLTGCGRSGQGEPIFIGHLAPLQGSDKSSFEHTRQGMTLALEELNQKRNNTPARPFVVLHVNAEEDLDQLQASAVRLLTVNRAIALIGGRDALQVERLTRAVQPYDTPLLTPATIAPSLATEYLYSLEPSPARLSKAISRWLGETIKGEALAFVFDSRSPVAAALSTALRGELSQSAKSSFLEQPFGTSPKFKETSEALLHSKAKAWTFFGKSEDFLALRLALREAGGKLPCLVLDSVGPLDLLPPASDKDGDLYQLTTYFAQEQDKAAAAFQASYSKRFHGDPDLYAAQGYDAVRLIAEASAAGKTSAAGKLAVELNNFIKTPFASSTGSFWFDKTDHSASSTLYLLQRTEKQPRLVFKLEAPPPS